MSPKDFDKDSFLYQPFARTGCDVFLILAAFGLGLGFYFIEVWLRF